MKKKKSIILPTVWHGTILFFAVLAAFRILTVIVPNIHLYTDPYYTEDTYQGFEQAFNHSQYRQKENPGIIPDESVYSYAAGAYLRGVDPILINSERAPLGKYLLALSLYLFKNDRLIILPLGILTLVSLWVLGYQALKDRWLALIPVIILSFEPLFLNQFVVIPLLDIIQLPFILLSLFFFSREEKRGIFLWTSIMIGISAATKTLYTGILLYAVFGAYMVISKQYQKLLKLCIWSPLTILIFCASYAKTFFDGYSVQQFIGFQKWILLYDQSKLMFPFSIWRLVFLNQWQAWWGDFRILRADDWQVSWPIATGTAFVIGVLAVIRKIKLNPAMLILVLWMVIYGIYISLGISSSRFLLTFFPVCYIIATYGVFQLARRVVKIF